MPCIHNQVTILIYNIWLNKPNENKAIILSYLNIKVKFTFLHFDSFIPRCYKFGSVLTLAFRCRSICYSMKLFQNEITILEDIFGKDELDNRFFGKCLQTILNKTFSKKLPKDIVSKKDIYIFFP